MFQRLLDDIKSNKSRTEVVLEQHASIQDRSGESTPSQGDRLLQEIGQLEEAAEFQCSELRAAVAEQEQYETEIRHLNAAISEAQQQLLASPVRASTVEALKQQIAEHNVCTSLTSLHTLGGSCCYYYYYYYYFITFIIVVAVAFFFQLFSVFCHPFNTVFNDL